MAHIDTKKLTFSALISLLRLGSLLVGCYIVWLSVQPFFLNIPYKGRIIHHAFDGLLLAFLSEWISLGRQYLDKEKPYVSVPGVGFIIAGIISLLGLAWVNPSINNVQPIYLCLAVYYGAMWGIVGSITLYKKVIG